MVITSNWFFLSFLLAFSFLFFGFLCFFDGLKLRQAIDGLQFVCCQAIKGWAGRQLQASIYVYLQLWVHREKKKAALLSKQVSAFYRH